MRPVVTILVAIVLLLSSVLAPRLEAASSLSTATARSGCPGHEAGATHSCCCGHPAGVPCPCEVAPSTPRPEPLERASVSSSERPGPALAPSHFAPAPARTSLTLLDRFGRHGHIEAAGPRIHLLEGVFRE